MDHDPRIDPPYAVSRSDSPRRENWSSPEIVRVVTRAVADHWDPCPCWPHCPVDPSAGIVDAASFGPRPSHRQLEKGLYSDHLDLDRNSASIFLWELDDSAADSIPVRRG